MVSRAVILLITLIVSQKIFGHGEDKLGPNGGYVRMPGAFHTELVAAKDHFKVYLLDIEFKNPAIANSTVEFTLKQKGETKESCKAQGNVFTCKLPSGVSLKSGEVSLKATRNGVSGGIVSYNLPLSLEKRHH